jgi:acyl-CoA thioester hydrolase
VRITFEYEIYNEANVLINRGETQLVFIDKQTNRPCRPPQQMEDVLQPFFT